MGFYPLTGHASPARGKIIATGCLFLFTFLFWAASPGELKINPVVKLHRYIKSVLRKV